MMTREEAIGRILDHMEAHRMGVYPHIKIKEALDLALSALRGPTRDMVERMRGEWVVEQKQTYIPIQYNDNGNLILHDYTVYRCSICGRTKTEKEPFCNCGAPMTDEAVDMMLERWKEAVQNG